MTIQYIIYHTLDAKRDRSILARGITEYQEETERQEQTEDQDFARCE